MTDRSSTPDYFELLYAANADPWGYATADYERDKYTATLEALPRSHFRSAFEIGCSIGVLTKRLAARCDVLLAVDMVGSVVRRARDSCRGISNVELARMQIPAEWPERRFDLVVLSEVLYYLSRADLCIAARKTMASLEPDGVVVLVHWLGDTGAAGTGEAAASQFIAAIAPALRVITQTRSAHYRLDVLAH